MTTRSMFGPSLIPLLLNVRGKAAVVYCVLPFFHPAPLDEIGLSRCLHAAHDDCCAVHKFNLKCLVSLYCTMNNKCLYKHVKCFHSSCNLHDTASNCTDSAVGKAGVIFASALSLTAGLAAVLLAEQIVEANLVMLNLEPMGSSVYCVEGRLPYFRGSCTQYTCP